MIANVYTGRIASFEDMGRLQISTLVSKMYYLQIPFRTPTHIEIVKPNSTKLVWEPFCPSAKHPERCTSVHSLRTYGSWLACYGYWLHYFSASGEAENQGRRTSVAQLFISWLWESKRNGFMDSPWRYLQWPNQASPSEASAVSLDCHSVNECINGCIHWVSQNLYDLTVISCTSWRLSWKLQSDHQCSPVPCSVELAHDLWIRKVMYNRNFAAQ